MGPTAIIPAGLTVQEACAICCPGIVQQDVHVVTLVFSVKSHARNTAVDVVRQIQGRVTNVRTDSFNPNVMPRVPIVFLAVPSPRGSVLMDVKRDSTGITVTRHVLQTVTARTVMIRVGCASVAV